MNDWPVYTHPIRDVPRVPRTQAPEDVSVRDVSPVHVQEAHEPSLPYEMRHRLPHPDLRDALRNLTMVRAGLSTALRRCADVLAPPNESVPKATDAPPTALLRDVLHLRARIEGLQAGTEDALSVLTRISEREV